MQKFILLAALIGALGTPVAAQAKGCIKGAIVGGVAGHYAGHHGLMGAAAGCVVGRHEANKRAREQREYERANAPH
jgi:uncharacterized protein YcfJ